LHAKAIAENADGCFLFYFSNANANFWRTRQKTVALIFGTCYMAFFFEKYLLLHGRFWCTGSRFFCKIFILFTEILLGSEIASVPKRRPVSLKLKVGSSGVITAVAAGKSQRFYSGLGNFGFNWYNTISVRILRLRSHVVVVEG
jgi:hypothetical protein